MVNGVEGDGAVPSSFASLDMLYWAASMASAEPVS